MQSREGQLDSLVTRP
nr:unnamed protein product [Callosobruchus chinensis]CAH7755617.1 unnamed protein product [Callosobruchus chinensis]